MERLSSEPRTITAEAAKLNAVLRLGIVGALISGAGCAGVQRPGEEHGDALVGEQASVEGEVKSVRDQALVCLLEIGSINAGYALFVASGAILEGRCDEALPLIVDAEKLIDSARACFDGVLGSVRTTADAELLSGYYRDWDESTRRLQSDIAETRREFRTYCGDAQTRHTASADGRR